MDASDEFRFINTTTTTSTTGSCSRRARRHSERQSGSNSSSSSAGTNSLRSVPVCVYNENRSFKLRFFWDKAFKLFHSARPVYRAVSGINYQDCGTIGSCSAAATGGGGSASEEASSVGLVKVRSQSYNQLNKVGCYYNEMEMFRSGRHHHHQHHVVHRDGSHSHSMGTSSSSSAAAAVAGVESRIVAVTSGSGVMKSESTRRLVVDNVNGHGSSGGGGGGNSPEELDFIPVVVPRKKNRAFGFTTSNISGGGDGGGGNGNGNGFTTSTATPSNQTKKKRHTSNSFLLTRPVSSSSISGGEKPQQQKKKGDGNANESSSSSSSFYSNLVAANNNTDNNVVSMASAAATSATGTSVIVPPHSKNHPSCRALPPPPPPTHVIVPSHHSTVSALSAPVHLRRSQSTKSHHSSYDPVQHHTPINNATTRESNKGIFRSSSTSRATTVPSPTPSAYESWKSSVSTGKGSQVGSSSSTEATTTTCPCQLYSQSKKGCYCDYSYSNCDDGRSSSSCHEDKKRNYHHHQLGQEDYSSDTIGNDSGLDTWKKGSSGGDDDECGMRTCGEERLGIVCTISQRIPPSSFPDSSGQSHNNYRISDVDYSTVTTAAAGIMNRCGGGGEDEDDGNILIDSGSVMYDSLDDTYSVPPANGNTTVVLINGCCEFDHCQNATLSDTFNFSDYDIECMSEIDLHSESGGSGSSTVEPNPADPSGNTAARHQHQHNRHGNLGSSNSNDAKYIICHSTSENELDSLDLAMFETSRASSRTPGGMVSIAVASRRSENSVKLYPDNNSHNNHNDSQDDRNSSLCAETGGVVVVSGSELSSQLLLQEKYNVSSSYNTGTTSSTSGSTVTMGNGNKTEEMYANWSDAGSEFEFVGPSSAAAAALFATTGLNRDIPMGHSPRGNPPDVEWEPYFCVLNQLDQTFTSYRSEEMSIFPGTPTRPRTQTNVFGENGISPTEIPRVRLDGGPNSIKCLINNAKWGMNTLMEEEEESNNTTGMASASSNGNDKGDYSSSSGSSSNQRTSSSPTSPLDTSYDKACGSERRGSAPLTPLLGRETPSRFANFFSKRSFKSNPLKRTKSVTKLERKKASGVIEPESGNILYPSRMRISRSHESLLAWTNNPVNSFVSNGMMSTMDLTAGDVSIRPLHPSILGQEYAYQVTTPTGSKYYTCSSAAERDSWVYALRQAIRPRADEVRRRENALKLWILEGKGIPGGSSGKHSSKRYFCELYLDDVLYARTCGKPKGEMLFWGEHFEFTQLPNCVQLITVVFFREGDKKRKKERNTCIGKVKIPVNSVTSRYLIEKWYPVLPESSSHSSKEKEHPSLRIKCKYQSVDILPLRCYKSFLQYVKDQYGPLSECLESVLSVKAKEDLASAMVHVLHHEGLAKEFIAELALQEILKSGDEKLTFRGNSIATKAMEAFLKLTGTEYLHATLGPFIEQFQGSEDLYDCEIDPMKLPMGANLSKNQQNLRMAVDTVWKAIMHSHSIFPMELRECFSHCREALKSAGKEELSDHLISASIFLRFLCPAILSPSLFNITNEYPSEKSARNLTLIAKVLQTLANFTRFQGKENYMEFINDFVEREASNMKAFLSCISSPLNPEAVKKAQKESRDKVPAGGFIDLGKYLSILSTLLSENVAKIAPKNDRFKHLQELLETIHKWLEQPANATNVSMFPFPHLPSPPPSGPPPPAPLGIPMNHRFSNPLCNNNSQAINHQYQIPHHVVNASATPIYAVSSVIHNNSNPNVKNISQVQMNMNGNCIGGGNGVPAYPLQLQIPHVNPNQIGINNQRSGSQASSGYQSQSPVLEGDDKGNNKIKSSHIKDQINAHINNINLRATEMQDATTALTFNNPVFNRKAGSQSVDDLSTVGVEKGDEAQYPRRLARSSSSSDCEYSHANISPTKGRPRGQTNKLYSNQANISGQQLSVHSKSQSKSGQHHRLSRRSSAELLRKNHPYSSSSDEDSDSGLVNERDEPTPHLPPRRNHIKRNSGHRPVPDGSSNGEKSLEEYEREMLELRRAMEALQVKLSRAEERLFGNESPGQKRSSGEMVLGSPANSGGGSGNGSKDRYSRSSDDGGCKEMDQLLQRLLSAEEEMKREHDLLTALDKKQKLIEAQEQKIARLDAVNNQLLQALAQIRDSLQQQHVQQQQQKIQQQLLKQQQHLKNLANGFMPPCNHTVHQSSVASQNSLNNNGSLGSRPNRPNQLQFSQTPVVHRDSLKNVVPSSNKNNCNANNTTKVLITSSSSESLSQATATTTDSHCDPTSNHNNNNNNRDSSAILGEQALQMLAELRSSSC